jgi:hypothetical protein
LRLTSLWPHRWPAGACRPPSRSDGE